MSVECDCGEPLGDGQTFCRRCGKRVGSRKANEELTRDLGQSRPGGTVPPPYHQPQQVYPPPPEKGGGPSFKVIAGGLVVLIVLAAGGYAFATMSSDGESDSNGAKVLDIDTPTDTDGDPDRDGGSGGDAGETDEDRDRGDSGRPTGDEQLPPIPPYREDCGNEVYAAGSASCPFSRNIAATYRDAPGPMLYNVYSPETKVAYDVECSEDGYVTCEGGVNATAYFYP